jgi:hypothetical protein
MTSIKSAYVISGSGASTWQITNTSRLRWSCFLYQSLYLSHPTSPFIMTIHAQKLYIMIESSYLKHCIPAMIQYAAQTQLVHHVSASLVYCY